MSKETIFTRCEVLEHQELWYLSPVQPSQIVVRFSPAQVWAMMTTTMTTMRMRNDDGHDEGSLVLCSKFVNLRNIMFEHLATGA